ncbi:MAG: Adenosine monophosphate-protein transferase SoFic [Elusimicrobia bacterium ADurb.Bin231]|nr:MAG: Adenosine monophosphate-protein transferase SoFic [Elusimicrobia bacterium ADurb.Bin231]
MKKISEKLLEKCPWISFKINLRELSFTTWMLLGQCVSKCDHIKRIPLSPAVRKELHKVYLIKGVVATTAIEGNTLTEEQVRDILENKANIEPSKKYLEQEVRNIIEACNEIGRNIRSEKYKTVSNELICELNKNVLTNVPVEDGAIPGAYRNRQVGVGRYRAPAAQDVSHLMNGYCEWLSSFDGAGIDEIAAAIIKAIASHLYFVLIHPFDDGNGRTARLLEFMILLSSGAPSPAAHLLSNHYNATRAEYYRHLDKISKTKGDMSDFFAYAIQGLRDGLQDVIDTIIVQVQMVSWRHYVYQIFKPIENDSAKRQREILFLLSECANPLPLSEIEKLTAKYYLDKGKTQKSFTRDWNSLLKTDMIAEKDGKYSPNYSLILNQLPFSM